MNNYSKNQTTPSAARITTAYQSAYPDPLKVKAGETLTVAKNDTEWPGFVWCTNQSGKGGWMPENYINRKGSVGLARCDYEATELSVNVGQIVTIHQVESDWAWCRQQSGSEGWVPLKHIEITSTCKHLFSQEAVAPYDFTVTVQAHGWSQLCPFEWDPSTAVLSRTHQLKSGQVVQLRMQADSNLPYAVQTQVESIIPLNPAEDTELQQAVRRMFRLDEDLTEFYALNSQMNDWNLRLQPGGGRLLRCPTLFEDIVYTLCTTNIAWSGTKRMLERLTSALGSSFPGARAKQAFPQPQAIANAGSEFLKKETRLGYRSPYLWELASSVAEGNLALSLFEDPALSTPDLHQALGKIKGVGNYAAATILMLLGRYEHLAIDSEMRAFVSKKYTPNQRPTDAQIRNIYAPWGRWQYLAYWFDAES